MQKPKMREDGLTVKELIEKLSTLDSAKHVLLWSRGAVVYDIHVCMTKEGVLIVYDFVVGEEV